MSRLDPEARMTITTLAARGASNSDIARLLGVTEGAVRYHVARMQTGALDGRSRQEPKAAVVAAAYSVCLVFLSLALLAYAVTRM